MTNFTHGQAINVIAGRHAGKTAWFNKASNKPGGQHAFVWFKTQNMSGAQVRLDEIEAA